MDIMGWILAQVFPVLLVLNWQQFSSVGSQDLISVNKPIKVTPPEASCNKGTIRLPPTVKRQYLAYAGIRTDDVEIMCSKTTPCRTEVPPVERLCNNGANDGDYDDEEDDDDDDGDSDGDGDSVLEIGQDDCSFPAPQAEGSGGPSGRSEGQFCFHEIWAPRPKANKGTWMFKFKPGNRMVRGALLDTGRFWLEVGRLKLSIRYRDGYSMVRGNSSLPLKDDWNSIAIQWNIRGNYNIFLDGELRSELMTSGVPSGRRASRRRRRRRQINPTPVPNIRHFRVGAQDAIGPIFAKCSIVKNDICRSSNASAFYMMSNRFAEDAEENERLFQRSLNGALRICSSFERQSLIHYLCSLHFPSCINGAGIEPCTEFCQEITAACPALADTPPFNCPSLKSISNFRCTPRHVDGHHLLKGKIKDLEFYDNIIIDQEIYLRNKGRLPEVSRPECLCSQDAPHVSGPYCYDDMMVRYPRVPNNITSTRNQTHTTAIIKNDFLPGFMNDGAPNPFGQKGQGIPVWVSALGTSKFTVQIDLEDSYLITAVNIYLVKPAPSRSLTLQRRHKNEWNTFHHFAKNCEDLNLPPAVFAERPGVVGCTPYSMAGLENIGQNGYSASWNHHKESIGFADYSNHGDERVSQYYTGDALRIVFDGLSGGNITDESENYHAVSEIEVRGRKEAKERMPCQFCYRNANEQVRCNDAGQCQCDTTVDTSIAGNQCLPFIESLYPTFGPKAGSTLIVIKGGGFGEESRKLGRRVSLGNLVCDVNNTISNSTLIVCLTPPVTDDALLGKPLVIRLTTTSGFVINYRYPFIYKPDAVIEDIVPRESITRGGVYQTIIGQHVDSVYRPQLIVYMTDSIKPGVTTLGPHVCQVRNSTLMECPTPEIPLPRSHTHLNKRSIADPEVSASYGNREKRATQMNFINDHQLDWHMGLILDGITTYINLTKSLPGKSQLLIFTSPRIDLFDPEVQVFKVHKGQRAISLKGDKLQYGVQKDDYHISIGNEVCTVSILHNNLVVCSPPVEAVPSAMQHDVHESGALRVQVRIGQWYTTHVGFLKYEMTLWDDPAVKTGVIVAIVLLLVILLAAYPLYKYIKHKRALKPETTHHTLGQTVSYYREENDYQERKDLLNRIDPALRLRVKPCLIDADRLTCQHEIGKGNFGVVYVGILKDQGGASRKVAVKTIKEHSATLTQISEFLGEAAVMQEFEHKNVLSLIGIVIQGHDVYVILPYMENGSLKHYLQKKENTFTVLDLVHLSSQACDGMAYIESMKFVHRDLAARNCMLDDKKVVKIADFGLARDIYETEYYRPEDRQRPLPYKWMAIECVVLDAKKFTHKSDVWSFGVLLWEVLTRGRTPYSDIPANNFGRYLRSNGRLEKPANCPDEVYEIMRSCWRPNPDDRPNFSDLVGTFEALLGPTENPQSPGYTRLSTRAQRGANSNLEYSEANNYAADYLQLVDIPAIENLLLPEEPKPNGNPQQPRGQQHPATSASNGTPPIPEGIAPPPPHSKPTVAKKPTDMKTDPMPSQPPPPAPHHLRPPVPPQGPEEDYTEAAPIHYDNNYLHAS